MAIWPPSMCYNNLIPLYEVIKITSYGGFMKLEFYDRISEANKRWFQNQISLERDFEILNENDQCQNVLFLLSGEIEVYKLSVNGKQFRLYTIKAGESCVLNLSCVLSDNNYMAFAKASTDITCLLVPQDEFLRIFNEEESLRNYVFNLISTRLIQITAKVEGIVLDTIENRLQEWLLDQGHPLIYTTHEELAGHLGSAREVISRQLKKWEKEGKVKLNRGRIEIINL